MRRIFQILGVAIVFFGVVALGYFFRGGSGKNTPQPAEDQGLFNLPPVPVFPSTPEGGNAQLPTTSFGVIANTPTIGFFVTATDEVLLVTPGGEIVRVAGGATSSVSSAPIPEAATASFSFNGEKILVSFGSPGARRYSVFDVKSKTWQPLPAGVADPVWAPNNLRIAFFSVGETSANLTTLDLGNARALPTTILRLHVDDMRILWPKSDRLVLTPRGAATTRGSVIAINPGTGAVTPLIDDLPGVMLSWATSPDRGLLFSAAASERGGYLNIVSPTGTITGLSLTTFPEKCAFFVPRTTSTKPATPPTNAIVPGTTLVCGTPQNYPQLRAQALPDAYEKHAVYSVDDLYAIDAITGATTPIITKSPYAFDVDRAVVVGTKFFFINRFDQKVYGIELVKP